MTAAPRGGQGGGCGDEGRLVKEADMQGAARTRPDGAYYVVCLVSMAAQAAVLWRTGVERAGVLALGGALFVTSDALLATNRFAAAFPAASLWNLATYWLAQWCIASWLPAAGVRVGNNPADMGQAMVDGLEQRSPGDTNRCQPRTRHGRQHGGRS